MGMRKKKSKRRIRKMLKILRFRSKMMQMTKLTRMRMKAEMISKFQFHLIVRSVYNSSKGGSQNSSSNRQLQDNSERAKFD